MAEIHIYKMKINPYIGHEAQLWGVEEVRLQGGKGDGMRLLNVYNGAGSALSPPPGPSISASPSVSSNAS